MGINTQGEAKGENFDGSAEKKRTTSNVSIIAGMLPIPPKRKKNSNRFTG